MEKLFKKYEEIRKSGRYNMVMDAGAVAAEMGCQLQQYAYILKNYSELKERYQ